MQPVECEQPAVFSRPNGDVAGRQWQLKLADLGRLSDERLAAVDIAALNLLVAEGLPGTENLDTNECLQKIEDWTRRVRSFTDDNWRVFMESPEIFGNSVGDFKIGALNTFLSRHLGVKYNLAFSEGEYDGSDARNLFLHGMLGGFGGTCLTMPVLYIAIGRRLGYPLHFVMAKEHYFVRWEGAGERFNIEATSPDFTPLTDDDLRVSPRPLTQADVAQGVYLRNLRPREVLAEFLSARGTCFFYNLRIPEALSAFDRAYSLGTRLPAAFFGWLACSMLMDGILHAERKALAAGRQTIDLRTLRLPSHTDDEKRRASAMAMERLQEVIRLGTADPVIPLPI